VGDQTDFKSYLPKRKLYTYFKVIYTKKKYIRQKNFIKASITPIDFTFNNKISSSVQHQQQTKQADNNKQQQRRPNQNPQGSPKRTKTPKHTHPKQSAMYLM